MGSAAIIPFSIGYTSFEYLRNTRSSKLHIKLINESGKIITCNNESIQAATTDVEFSDKFTADLTNSDHEDAWPITSYSYIVTRSKSTKPKKCEEFWNAIKFFQFTLKYHAPEVLIESNGFTLVGKETQNKILDLLRTFECNNEQRFASGIPIKIPPEPEYFYFSPNTFSEITTVNYTIPVSFPPETFPLFFVQLQ